MDTGGTGERQTADTTYVQLGITKHNPSHHTDRFCIIRLLTALAGLTSESANIPWLLITLEI